MDSQDLVLERSNSKRKEKTGRERRGLETRRERRGKNLFRVSCTHCKWEVKRKLGSAPQGKENTQKYVRVAEGLLRATGQEWKFPKNSFLFSLASLTNIHRRVNTLNNTADEWISPRKQEEGKRRGKKREASALEALGQKKNHTKDTKSMYGVCVGGVGDRERSEMTCHEMRNDQNEGGHVESR